MSTWVPSIFGLAHLPNREDAYEVAHPYVRRRVYSEWSELDLSVRMTSDRWWAMARCAQPEYADVDFFPEWGSGHGADEARAICRHCPVRGACLDEALEEEDGSVAVGVRGGALPAHRRRILLRRHAA